MHCQPATRNPRSRTHNPNPPESRRHSPPSGLTEHDRDGTARDPVPLIAPAEAGRVIWGFNLEARLAAMHGNLSSQLTWQSFPLLTVSFNPPPLLNTCQHMSKRSAVKSPRD